MNKDSGKVHKLKLNEKKVFVCGRTFGINYFQLSPESDCVKNTENVCDKCFR